MTWLTWRQFRVQALTAFGALATVALLLALTGGHLAQLAGDAGLTGCVGDAACAKARSAFYTNLQQDQVSVLLYYAGLVLLYVVPALLGVFWGAPLVAREVEAGTFRLAWSQSVPRLRWLAVKLGMVGPAAAAVSGLLSLAVGLWAAPIDHAAGVSGGAQGGGQALADRFSPLVFGARGVLPAGVAVFALVLGVSCGLLLRRVLPAMAVTLLVLTAVQVALPLGVRAQYQAPVRTTAALTLEPGVPGENLLVDGNRMRIDRPVDLPGAWVTSIRAVDASGRPWNGPAPQICLSPTVTPQRCFDAVNALRLRQVVEYQPADRYWTFQWIETGLYLLGAAVLAGLCAWRIRSLPLN